MEIGVYSMIKSQHRFITEKINSLEVEVFEERDTFLAEFARLYNFFLGVHAKIEEQVLFPAVAMLIQDLGVTEKSAAPSIDVLGRLAADHIMLEKLGGEICSAGKNLDERTLKSRFYAYKRISIYHDATEEQVIETVLKAANKEPSVLEDGIEKAEHIIDSYGREKLESYQRENAI